MNIARPIIAATTRALHKLPPERAHRLAIDALRYGLAPRFAPPSDPILRSTVFGIDFPNPIGLAAGFDKNAEAPDALLRLGFGFVEVGTITPLAQIGNPKPRLFRDPANQALINRLGFNGQGLDAALARLEGRPRRGIVGANVGRNKLSPDGIADYARCIERLARHVDFLVMNVSSPNTPGLRDMQEAAALTTLIESGLRARDAAQGTCPLLVKVALDLDDAALQAIVEVAIRYGISALILHNTSTMRPDYLAPQFAAETGGLSGPPIRSLGTDRMRVAYRAAGGRIPLIGGGGITSAADAFERIQAGASLVQLYTGLIYEGPTIACDIAAGLVKLLRDHGFAAVSQAIGSAAD